MIQVVTKISKNIYILSIAIILVLGAFLALFFVGEKIDWLGKEEGVVLRDRGEVFDISGAKMSPDFVNELIIDPFYGAELGERQYFSIWTEDSKEVEAVKVIINNFETQVALVDLELKEGDNKKGRWEGTWIINNVKSGTVPVLIFQAQNKEGETAEIETYFYVKEAKQSWLRKLFTIKPVFFAALCFPLGNTSGDKLISSCSIGSGVTVGTDAGDITISGTITMEQNSTMLFESGHKIEFQTNAKILKSQTNTKIQKGDITATSIYALSVSKLGTGSGTVIGSGINCGSDCSEDYTAGTSVTLTASPASGSTFAGWSGACSGTGGCTVIMDSNKSVTATFNTSYVVPIIYTLSVFKSGTGSGTVIGPGINCGSDCSESYNSGTSVTLTASPASGSTFAGWSGACSGTGNCTVTMNNNKSVTATFNTSYVVPTTYTLSVSKSGTGSGIVSFNPPSSAVYYALPHSEIYDNNTSVTLTARPSTGSTFAGWSGEGCSGTGTCTVIMNSNKSVTATFNSVPIIPPTTCTSITVMPNPFSDSTTLRANGTSIYKSQAMAAYDLSGSKIWISSWINGTNVTWTGVDSSGQQLANGAYIVFMDVQDSSGNVISCGYTKAFIDRVEPDNDGDGYTTAEGDCCDSDSRVYPGSSYLSAYANNCGDFDYNCDGRETKIYTKLGNCSCSKSTFTGISGWEVSYIPDCGVRRDFIFSGSCNKVLWWWVCSTGSLRQTCY